MKYNDEHINIDDIKAEILLALITNKNAEVSVSAKGSFYRNFSEDVMQIEDTPGEILKVELSRDSIFHLLPEALFFHENTLLLTRENKIHKKQTVWEEAVKAAIQKQNRDKEDILSFFKAFDSRFFQVALKLERKVFELEEKKVAFLLKWLFDYDLDEEINPYIKKLAPFILHASEIRGDLMMVKKIIEGTLGAKTEIRLCYKTCKKPVDEEELFLFIRFIIHVPGLSSLEYRKLMELYKPFFQFLDIWFLPVDTNYEYKIKDTSQHFTLRKPLVLDYNTQFI